MQDLEEKRRGHSTQPYGTNPWAVVHDSRAQTPAVVLAVL